MSDSVSDQVMSTYPATPTLEGIPLELRRIIFGFVLEKECKNRICLPYKSTITSVCRHYCPSLRTVNEQIGKEFEDYFHWNVIFVVVCGDDTSDAVIHEDNAKAMQLFVNIEIKVAPFSLVRPLNSTQTTTFPLHENNVTTIVLCIELLWTSVTPVRRVGLGSLTNFESHQMIIKALQDWQSTLQRSVITMAPLDRESLTKAKMAVTRETETECLMNHRGVQAAWRQAFGAEMIVNQIVEDFPRSTQPELAISEDKKIKPPVIPAVKGWFCTSKIDPALLEYDKMKPVIEDVIESLRSPQPEVVISEYEKMKPVVEAVKESLQSPQPESASPEYDKMRPVIERVRESLCPRQPGLSTSEYMKIEHDSVKLQEYMKFQVQTMFNRPSNAGTMWPVASIFDTVQVRSAHREQESAGACNKAHIMRSFQAWSNDYINNINNINDAVSPCDPEESLALSSLPTVQSIEADDACCLARDTLARVARAALQAMSNNMSNPPQTGKGKRKHEERCDKEGAGLAQVTLSRVRVPLRIKPSNVINTGRARNKKRKHA